jgi:four helix bundle protein
LKKGRFWKKKNSFLMEGKRVMTNLKKFKTYELSVRFYRACLKVKLPGYLKDQLARASSSVVLNIAEASSQPTFKSRNKFFNIALCSLRESQAALDLAGANDPELESLSDQIAACLYRLTHPKR